MPSTSTRRGARAGLAALALVLGLAAAPVGAQVPVADADFSGYATGTVTHVTAIQTGTTRVADTELAFSGASVASAGLGSQLVNETGTVVQPALPAAKSYARGSGLELGVVTPVPDNANQVVLAQKAEASAPPSSPLVTREIGPAGLDPVAYASLLRGQAQARWVNGTCVLGADLSRGLGYAADAMLVDTAANTGTPTLDAPVLAADAPTPERRVSQSVSRTALVPQIAEDGTVLGSSFGLMSETRMTIAPVTLFKGTPNQITIEFLGEWVLRAVATGMPGGAFVHYGPGAVSPSTPVLSIIPSSGTPTQVLLQQILGPTGLTVDVPGLVSIAVGEAPRAIGGAGGSAPTEAADGTQAAAAVHVVRVSLLPGSTLPLTALDLRIGHMETRARVPAGGIACGLPAAKRTDPASVASGGEFRTDMTITNPYDCELNNVVAEDRISITDRARYAVTAVSDGGTYAGSDRSGTATWALGSIPAHSSRTISVTFNATAGPGTIDDTVTATGVCGVGSVDGTTTVQAQVAGTASAQVPVGNVRVLAMTGGPTAAFVALATLMIALAGLLLATALRVRSLEEA